MDGVVEILLKSPVANLFITAGLAFLGIMVGDNALWVANASDDTVWRIKP